MKLEIQRDQIYALFQLKAFSKNRQLVSQKNQIRNQVPRCEIGIGHFFEKHASQTLISFLVSEASGDEMVKGDMSRLVFDWILLSSQSPQLFPKKKRFRYPHPANSMRCIYLMIRKTQLNKISANIKNRLHLPIAKVFQVRYLHHLTQNYAISRWLLGFIIALPHLINIWNHNFCFTFGTSYISVLVLLCYSSKSGGSSRKKRLDLYCLIPPPNGQYC